MATLQSVKYSLGMLMIITMMMMMLMMMIIMMMMMMIKIMRAGVLLKMIVSYWAKFDP